MRFFQPIRQALIRDGKAVRYAAYVGPDLGWPEDEPLPVRYDLDQLRASSDFALATHNALHTFISAEVLYGLLGDELRTFLDFLDTYD